MKRLIITACLALLLTAGYADNVHRVRIFPEASHNSLAYQTVEEEVLALLAEACEGTSFRVIEDMTDELKMRHVRMQQRVNDLDVVNKTVMAHYTADGKLYYLNGSIVTDSETQAPSAASTRALTLSPGGRQPQYLMVGNTLRAVFVSREKSEVVYTDVHTGEVLVRRSALAYFAEPAAPEDVKTKVKAFLYNGDLEMTVVKKADNTYSLMDEGRNIRTYDASYQYLLNGPIPEDDDAIIEAYNERSVEITSPDASFSGPEYEGLRSKLSLCLIKDEVTQEEDGEIRLLVHEYETKEEQDGKVLLDTHRVKFADLKPSTLLTDHYVLDLRNYDKVVQHLDRYYKFSYQVRLNDSIVECPPRILPWFLIPPHLWLIVIRSDIL